MGDTGSGSRGTALQFRALALLGCGSEGPLLQSNAGAAGTGISYCLVSIGGPGDAAWSAVQTLPNTVQVLLGGTPHTALHFPEPLLALQLGAQLGDAGPSSRAEGGGQPQAVLVAVGESGCAWAWEMRQQETADGKGEPVGMGAEGRGSASGEAGGRRRVKRKLDSAPAAALDGGPEGMDLEEGGTAQTISLGLAGAGAGFDPKPWMPAVLGFTPTLEQLQVQTSTLQQHPLPESNCPGIEACLQLAQPSLAATPAVAGVVEAGGRAQLAAQVVWEYLDARAQAGKALGSSHAGTPGAWPIPLSGLPAAPAGVVHSVASWAASSHLPPDACCACYVAARRTSPSQGLSFCGSTRYRVTAGSGGEDGCPGVDGKDWRPEGTSNGDPLGFLLVGTVSGRVETFPMGSPLMAPSSTLPATVGSMGSSQLLVVQHGSQLLPMWLPPGPAGAPARPVDSAPLKLLLHAASGRVSPNSAVQGSSKVLVAGGSQASDSGSTAGPGTERRGPLAAVLRVSGDVDCICVQGHVLYYATASKLYGLDCSALVQHASPPGRRPDQAQEGAVRIPTPAPILLLATPSAGTLDLAPQQASTAPGPAPWQELLLLSCDGTLLRMRLPAGKAWLAQGGGGQERVGFGQLEGEMQELLGHVARLSALQESQSSSLRQLDSRIAHLAAAIPAVQSVNTGSAMGLHCMVRPLYPLAQVLGSGGRQGLAAQVVLVNGGRWALPAGLSLLMALAAVHPSPGCKSAPGLSKAHSIPLPPLHPGASHTVTCFLDSPGPASQCLGLLHVLLCHHSTQGAAHAALLHSVRLDPLHLHRPSPLPMLGSLGGMPGSLHPLEQQVPHLLGQGLQRLGGKYSLYNFSPPQQPVEFRLRLQLPTWLFGRRPQASAALGAVLSQGLSSLDLSLPPPLPNNAAAASSRLSSSSSSSGGARAAAGSRKLQQREREGRQERQRRLLSLQVRPGAAPWGTGGEQVAQQGPERVEAAAWWDGLLWQQRTAHALSPVAAFSLLSGAHAGRDVTGHGSGAAAATLDGRPCVAADFPAAGAGKQQQQQQQQQQEGAVQVSARCAAPRGPHAGASWQHAELELTATATGSVQAALQAHAALVRRALAMQDSLPPQGLDGLCLGSSTLLAPQAGAPSLLDSVVENASMGELEAVLYTLRQLKGRAMQLRDEALKARAQAAGGTGAEAAQRQGSATQLRQDLAALALALSQQAGRLPVIVD